MQRISARIVAKKERIAAAYSCSRRCIPTRVPRIRGKNNVYVISEITVYVLKIAYTGIETRTYTSEKQRYMWSKIAYML